MVIIVLVAFIGVSLRWSGLGSQSLWLDEGYTFWISRLSPRDICHMLRMDTTSPLHYVMIHYWSEYFGSSEFSLRAFSAVLGSLSIGVFYLLARKILAERTAVTLAMMLYAVSYFQVWYAKEARCYTLLVFLSLGSVYSLILYLENRNLFRLCSLSLFLAASLYTHNIAFFDLPGMIVIWLIYPRERMSLGRVRDGLLVCSIVLLLYVPWLPTLAAQSQRIHRGFTLAIPQIQDLLDSVCVLSGFDTRALQTVFRGPLHTRIFGFWTWAPGLLVILGFCLIGGLYRVRSTDRRKTTALAVYVLSPLVLVFALSRVSNPIYVTRLFLGSGALLPILFCAPIAFQVGKRQRAFQVAGLGVLVGAVVSFDGYFRREQKEDWRGVTKYLLQLPEKERLVVIEPDIALPLVQYYEAKLSKLSPSIKFTGLLTGFNPPDSDLEKRILGFWDDPNTDKLAVLSHEMASGKYKEIDLTMRQPTDLPTLVKPVLKYLIAHCTSIETIDFCRIEVRRYSIR